MRKAAVILILAGLVFAAAAETVPLQVVPQDAGGYVFIDIDAIRKSEFGAAVEADRDFEELLKKIETNFGFNPYTDANSATFYLDNKSSNCAGIAFSLSDTSRIAAKLKTLPDYTLVNYGKYEIHHWTLKKETLATLKVSSKRRKLEVNDKPAPEPELQDVSLYLLVSGNQLLIFTSELSYATRVADVLDGKKPSLKDSPAEDPFKPGTIVRVRVPVKAEKPDQAIQEIFLDAAFNKDVISVTGSVLAKNEQDLQQVKAAIDGAKAIAYFALNQESPEVLKIINALVITVDKNRIRITWEMSQAELQKLAQTLKEKEAAK